MGIRTFVAVALAAGVLSLAAALSTSPAAARGGQDARAVADQAFERFTGGLATGRWDPFFEMLADDFTFSFPTGKYVGQHTGKEKAMEFFRYVSTAFPNGIKVTEVLRRTGSDRTFVFEFRDEGLLRGEPYKNRVAISLDVCGDRICGYREYFGSDGKTN